MPCNAVLPEEITLSLKTGKVEKTISFLGWNICLTAINWLYVKISLPVSIQRLNFT